ncbi:D-glycero-beta-D-manno-heptose-7-phosphate kinase [Desulfovibrio sp. 1188_IL3213]|uniref:D-glycero-beta-D-manno-heptose-7-phosphate kinase n=2 Tax=unclassified Desulfovibrio TaxID=2593640 RepID=UPI002FD8A595
MNFDKVRVLVVGDVMLDRYISGNVGRISPEAPVPVLGVDKRWFAPGGAANVARNLVHLGAQATLVGLSGMDEAADDLRRSLEQAGIQHRLVSSGSRSTTCKTRVLAQGQQLLRLDEERCMHPDDDELEALLQAVLAVLPTCHVVILSDYGKGVLLENGQGESLCRAIIDEARRLGVTVLVDPKGTQWSRYAGAHCVTPNRHEFDLVCGRNQGAPLDRAARADLADRLRERYAIERVLLTRGAKGMTMFSPDAPPRYIRAVMREVADVSGAGDTVIATLGACIGTGLTWEESMDAANAAAGVAVGKMGTAPVSITELRQALRQGADNPKLYALPELLEKVEDWRRKNESIVFTNGCFDLLHPGHISLIRQSAAQGTHLVVGLNSDASVRRLKGPSRPVQNEQSRALLLSALHGVDAVVLFDEDTPLNLVTALRPDVLVKGSDYTVGTVVGADVVLASGGRVYLADLVQGCSTTGIVRKIDASGGGRSLR